MCGVDKRGLISFLYKKKRSLNRHRTFLLNGVNGF